MYRSRLEGLGDTGRTYKVNRASEAGTRNLGSWGGPRLAVPESLREPLSPCLGLANKGCL